MTDKKSEINKYYKEKIEELLGLAGPKEYQILDLTIKILTHLVEQRFILEKEFWTRNSRKDVAINHFLNELFPSEKNWDGKILFQESALHFVRRLNNDIHSTAKTSGGKKYTKSLEEIQGGYYCVLCGKKEHLEVDHIVPVSRDGDEEDLNNMQFLCKECNSAKNNLSDDLLPYIIKFQKSSNIPHTLRYFLLLNNAVEINGRMHGKCPLCGTISKNTHLNVIIGIKNAAANYLNLEILCDACQKRRSKNA